MMTSIIVPLSLALTVLALNTISSSACSIRSNSIVTFYGYPDNDPPGASTAYNCGGRNNIAGGTGTYADPLTFASAQGEYNSCEIIYLPYLQKYLRYEDFCAQCTSDWSSGKAHIDVWTGSSTVNGGQTQIDCEDELTPNNQGILRQPTTNLPVNIMAWNVTMALLTAAATLFDVSCYSTPLFQNGKCNTGATYSNNNPSCGGGSTPSPPPPAGSCSWPGHCKGASCGNDNDCSDVLTCQNGHCAA